VLLTGAAAIVVPALARSRTHAITLAHRMTAGLSRSTEELREALMRAEAADRAKSQFVSNISHELRTPLNGIIGACQLLSRTTLDERQHRYVELGATSAEALLALVDDVLDLAKIESGAVELEQGPFDPARLVEQLVTEYTVTADGRLAITSTIDPDVPTTLLGDDPASARSCATC
jgi:signal transduction histidine kinase